VKATRQLAWLAALALLAQPLGALAVCQPADAAGMECCPGPHGAMPEPVKASADDPGCCEITSSEPTPSPALLKATETAATPATAPTAGAVLEAAPDAARLAADSPPRASSSPLHTLYCVFLI